VFRVCVCLLLHVTVTEISGLKDLKSMCVYYCRTHYKAVSYYLEVDLQRFFFLDGVADLMVGNFPQLVLAGVVVWQVVSV